MNIDLKFDSKELLKLISTLQESGVEARIVGGAVRDALLGKTPHDIDIAVNCQPSSTKEILEKAGYKTIPTGIDFGTITALIKNEPKYNSVEITSLRQDISTDGRRAVVSYTKDFAVDAERRDFTINSMSYNPISKQLYDYFGGLDDLRASKVRFIGDAEKRIEEDHLRILRFFRFSAYYASELDDEGLRSSKKHASLISKLSKERIHKEISKLFECKKDIGGCLAGMGECEIWRYIVAGFSPGFSGGLDIGFNGNLSQKLYNNIDQDDLVKFEEEFWKYSKLHPVSLEFIKSLRLGFLFFPLGREVSEKLMKFLKFSGHEINDYLAIYDFIKNIIDLETKKSIYVEICKSWYYNFGHMNKFLVVACILQKITEDEAVKAIADMSSPAPIMPITSAELMELGFQGLQLGIRKKYLETKWIESGFSLSKDGLLGS